MKPEQPVRAVAFDFGNVLSLPPDSAGVARLASLTGISLSEFSGRYMRDRLAYDRGAIEPDDYWRPLIAESGGSVTPELLEELGTVDALSWLTFDPQVAAWIDRLRAAGIATAILSNMPSGVLAHLRARHAGWLATFDAAVFSCEVACVKPERAIYDALLERLCMPAAQVLFLDDVKENADAAVEAGLQAIHYTSFEQVRLSAARFGLPVPT